MSKGEKPLVSIVIPVYNGANYLAEAIESALQQTYENCEIVVIDDGSNDNGATEGVAKSFGNKIRYYKKENGGVSSALNFGIELMRGEYFSWLSHDDIYYPQKIEKEIDAILASGDKTTLVQAEYEFYNMDNQTVTPTNFSKYYDVEELTNSVFSVFWLQIHACSALIHKSHFERVGKFQEQLLTLGDIEMWFRLFRGQKSIFIPEILHTVREHSEAGSNTISSHAMETGKTYFSLIQRMTLQEMKDIFGSAASFLCRMAGLVKSYGQSTELNKIHNLLKELPSEDKVEENTSISNLHAYLREISVKNNMKIAIFGAGQYGIRMKYELESRLVFPDFFIDNNPQKQGCQIDGIPCIAMSEAEQVKENILIIVAQRSWASGVQQIKDMKFSYYITKAELDGKILHTLPAMSRKEEWLK